MYKSKLQELCHKKNWDLPVYETVKDGPDHCPRFTTTVSIQGITFETPNNVCKSSKESQNVAAHIAFNHFNSAEHSISPAGGFIDTELVKNNSILQQQQGQNSQSSLAGGQDVIKPQDLHVFKNRLQHYAQKKNITLPDYSFEIVGPPHARQFRASVKIGGSIYNSPVYYSNLKDSEHAAAKVAFDSLSAGEVQEDEGLYKTLLQELVQKKSLRFPSYTTIANGPPHMRTFVSTVEIGGLNFKGRECRTKKLAEMNAAKVAYNGFLEREAGRYFSPGDNKMGNTEVRAVIPEVSTSHGNEVASNATETHVDLVAAGIGEFYDSVMKNAMDVTRSGVDSVATCDQQNIQPKSVNEYDGNAEDLHVFKNRLQHYAQKKNITLPDYSFEIVGPPHARQFRASVKIGGSIYDSPVYYSNLKDSEHAAAKVAFDSLSAGEVQEDEGLYKTLLQELVQKKGLRFPSYTTITNGPPHMRTFVSTVEIGGENFKGRECRTKKLAEMNAAKVAYNGVLEREAGRYFSPGDNKMGKTEVRAGIPEVSTSHGNEVASNATETHVDLVAAGIGEFYDSVMKNAMDVTRSGVDSVATCDQQNIQPKSVNEYDGNAEEPSRHGLDDSDAEKPTGVCAACCSKIIVLPRKSSIKIPVGSTILPYSDRTWVAAEVKGYQGQ